MKMQKAKSKTATTYAYDRKVKCACPGCGIDFLRSVGVKGDDSKLYCTQAHADIAKIIRGE